MPKVEFYHMQVKHYAYNLVLSPTIATINLSSYLKVIVLIFVCYLGCVRTYVIFIFRSHFF